MSNEMILFGNQIPDVYRLSDIYDPEIHGISPEVSGKQVPSTESLVVDKKPTGGYVLYVVKSVDPITFKSTLEAPKQTVDYGTPDRIVSYGNDILMLFYDTSFSPFTKLFIDAKLLVFGPHNVKYKLIQTKTDGSITPISLNASTGQQTWNLISSSNPPVKVFEECYLNPAVQLADGDIVTLQLYKSDDVMTTEIKLICRAASKLINLTDIANPVVALDAECNQKDSDGNWFLYKDQNVEDLAIYPRLEFAGGIKSNVSIDNEICFAYGLQDINTRIPGMKFDVLVKYFLSENMASVVQNQGSSRFLTTVKRILIKTPVYDRVLKLSVVPYWNTVLSQWQLRFFAYYKSRQSIGVEITDAVQYSGATLIPGNYTTYQTLYVTYVQTTSDGIDMPFTQGFTLWLKAPTADTPFLIQYETTPGLIDPSQAYGVSTQSSPRPVVFQTKTINNGFTLTKYAIPVTVFPTTAMVISSFYTRAKPPSIIELEGSLAPTPTHFIYRDLDGTILSGANPLPIENYMNEVQVSNVQSFPTKSVIMVEFLRQVGGPYQYLYGVPVEIREL